MEKSSKFRMAGFGILVGLGGILVVSGLIQIANSNKNVLTFTAEQIAEQNRQSAVATKLRQAERGYIAEMNNGELIKICGGGEIIRFCDINDHYGYDPMLIAKRVHDVHGPDDKEWAGRDGVAFKFMRGERTK